MNYTASGSILLGGCSNASITIPTTSLYEVGSVLYYKPKAVNGITEKVFIKAVRFKYFGKFGYSTLYIDGSNAYFNEEDLCEQEEAESLINDYNLRYASAIERLIRDC